MVGNIIKTPPGEGWMVLEEQNGGSLVDDLVVQCSAGWKKGERKHS
jgi:hypothetical protein